MRSLIVDLGAEYPGLNPYKSSRICYVRFGRFPARKTVKRGASRAAAPHPGENRALTRSYRSSAQAYLRLQDALRLPLSRYP